MRDVDAFSTIPLLKPKAPPRATNVNRYWFNPPWIAENERPDVDHGEFQSPVWLAVHMTMRSDRDRELCESSTPRHAQHAVAGPSSGQLRSMLAFVNGATQAGSSQLTPVTYIHGGVTAEKPSASSRYHDLPRPQAWPVRTFARFMSSNFGRVSVNHN
jgi:hypothetical protein